MPEIKLNDRTLRNLKTRKSQEDFKDATFTVGEFGVRVSSNGAKRFFVRYRVNDKRRRMMLGAYPGLSLADARKRAHKLCVDASDGKDPAKSKFERRQAGTVGALYELFMAQKRASFAVSTYRNYWAMWRKDCNARLGDLKAVDVERRHIVELLDAIELRTVGPHMVNRTRTMLMTMFNWAVAKDFCKYNPVIGAPKAQQRERPAERFLSRDEIRCYWESSEKQGAMERVYWRLLLLLALRPGEVMKLQWAWIDRDVLTIPGSEVKNGRTHSLFLSGLVLDELALLKQETGFGLFVFPSLRGELHRLDFTNSQKDLVTAMQCPFWTARDIRRTCETQMRTFIRDGEGISRVLNHDVSAIRKHYDRNDYFDRKKEVLLKWTAWLEKTIRDDENKVIDLAAHRGQAVS